MPRRARGEGTIRKQVLKSKAGTKYTVWSARITISWDGVSKKTKDGPRRRSQAEAKRDLRDMLEKKARGVNQSDDTLITEYIVKYLDHLSSNAKWGTYKAAQYNQRYYDAYLKRVSLNDLETNTIQEFVNTVYNDLRSRGFDGRSRTRQVHATLRAAYNHWRKTLPSSDPCRYKMPFIDIDLPSEVIDVPQLWDESECARFLEVAANSRFYALIYTALTTGLRVGELLALTWDDLEIITGDATVYGSLFVRHTLKYVYKNELSKAHDNHGLTHLHEQFFLDTPKTKASQSYVTVANDTLRVLYAQREMIAREAMSEMYTDLNLIFPTKHGTPYANRWVSAGFYRLIDKAQVPRIKFHDLRDTHATRLLKHVDISIVSNRLRHSTKSTTLDRYVHVLQKHQLDGAISLDDLLKD